MTEVVLSWGVLLVLLVVAFRLLSRYQHQRPSIRGVTVSLHTLSVGISLVFTIICTALLYDPIIAGFDIHMDGFMNMNGLLTFLVIWVVVSALALALLVKSRTLWGSYYRTLCITQVVLLLLPLLFVVVVMFLLVLKQ